MRLIFSLRGETYLSQVFKNESVYKWFPVYYFEMRYKYGRSEVIFICLNEFLNELALEWFPVYQENNGILELTQ